MAFDSKSSRLLLVAALLVALTVGVTSAAALERFGLDHYLTLRGVSGPTWSQDGNRLAFVVHEPDTAANTSYQHVWLADFERGDVRQLTRFKGANFSPSFSPSGDSLVFLSSRGTSDIQLMSLRGGEPSVLTTVNGGLGEVHWSPDGRYLAYAVFEPLPEGIKAWRDQGWDHQIEDERLQYPNVWVMEIATGKTRQLTRSRYIWYLRWSPDSRSIAFLTSPSGKPDDSHLVDIGIVSVNSGKFHELGVIGGVYTWSPDSKWIACATSLDRRELVSKNDLWVIPVASGDPINLTADFDEDGKSAVWNATSDTLFFHSAQGVSSMLAAVPFNASARSGGPVQLLLDRHAEALAPEIASTGRIAWVQSSPTEPRELWTAEHAGDVGRPLTDLNARVAALRLGTTSTFRWTSTDGVQVEGVLLRPPGARKGVALKTLVDLHGGPYASRHALSFHSRPQLFAAHGYQVFMPNFRASGGYGTAFMLRERNDWGGQDWRDVASGVDSLIEAGLADSRRLGLYGRSYGGYLTAWGITQTTRFDAACVITGAVDLPGLFGQSDVHQYRAYEFEGYPWETPDNWRRASPIAHIANVKTPTQILVGERDRRVPLAQAQTLYSSLRALEVPTEFVRYPGESHHLRKPRHRADQITRMLAWWDRWVR